ncbi:MAG: hypothetical protein IPG67_05475 [Acidobacteria bacterium]|nr:hypothetical protein [Acidobacteriota bacterium]MBK7933307.1 hypothetical protein [Acidobacteriota bacterium]
MAIGMTLTGLSFLVLYFGATIGEGMTKSAEQLAAGEFRINERVLKNLGNSGIAPDVLAKIQNAKIPDGETTIVQECPPNKTCKNSVFGVKFAAKDGVSGEQQLVAAINAVAPGEGDKNKAAFVQSSYLFRVSPIWLILAYAIVTLGELMLSPMGLSLVSKVAPISKRGLLMGGWFVATAIGNKLTMIGIYWDIWLQSSFFLLLACMALVMAVVLFAILKPLKKAMPGV